MKLSVPSAFRQHDPSSLRPRETHPGREDGAQTSTSHVKQQHGDSSAGKLWGLDMGCYGASVMRQLSGIRGQHPDNEAAWRANCSGTIPFPQFEDHTR